MAVAGKYTYADLLDIPDDRNRYEIIDGQLYVSPAPNMGHQGSATQFAGFFFRAEQAGFGRLFFAPCDVCFDEHNVVEPDLLFISTARLDIISAQNVQGAPDLLVEILSPSNRRVDLTDKPRLYERFGVPHYWVADPVRRTVRRFQTGSAGRYEELPELAGDDIIGCPLFPGITTAVSSLFR